MIERFVELAQKHAPELGIIFSGTDALRVSGSGSEDFYYSNDETGGSFTITILEYLKGLAKPCQEWAKNNPDAQYPPKKLEASERAVYALCAEWMALTPESVMQACIDVWEVME